MYFIIRFIDFITKFTKSHNFSNTTVFFNLFIGFISSSISSFGLQMCCKILWALAWFSHCFFFVWNSLCSSQASQALKFVFHRCVHGKSPVVSVFELFFCFANGLFLFLPWVDIYCFCLMSRYDESPSHPHLWAGRAHRAPQGQRQSEALTGIWGEWDKSPKVKGSAAGVLISVWLHFHCKRVPPTPLPALPQGTCLFLFPQVFSSRLVDNIRG